MKNKNSENDTSFAEDKFLPELKTLNSAIINKNRTIQKEYIALTWGEWAEDKGLIENKLSRSKKNPF